MPSIAVDEQPRPSPTPPRSATLGDVRVSSPLPLRKRFSLPFAFPGRMVVVSGLWITREGWRRRPESADPSWGTVPIGRGFLLAIRVDL